MYKVTANSREDYLKEAEQLGRDLKGIDKFIRIIVPGLEPWFYNVGPKEPGMTFKMLGYGKFTYHPNPGATVDWPVIGIALQKNYISMYLSITKNNKPLVGFYVDRLKSTRCGNNNFSFETLEQLDKTVFTQMLREAALIFNKDPQNPVQFKERR